MRILITGREGQLVRSLMERGAGDADLHLLPVGRPELDLERTETITPVVTALAPDIIINAAAYTSVDLAEDEPDRAAILNETAPAVLAETARRIGARIIHISTDYVFDGHDAEGHDEQAPTAPTGVYGRTKYAGEERVRAATPDHVIVRTAWVYSPFGRNFLKAMMALAETHDEIKVVGDQHGNPSSALDLADGLLTIIRAWQAGEKTGCGETYHLAGSGTASWFEFANHIMVECARRELASAKVRPISTSEWPTRARRPAWSLLDSSKFAHDFSFVMPDWKSSVTATIERLARARGIS